MDEAQERNLAQYFKQISKPLDDLWKDYLAWCKKRSLKAQSKDEFKSVLYAQGCQILLIDGKEYLVGRPKHDGMKPPYLKQKAVVSDKEFNDWLDAHGWRLDK